METACLLLQGGAKPQVSSGRE